MRAAALDANSKILGSTDAVDMTTGNLVLIDDAITEVDETASPSPTPSDEACPADSAGAGETSDESGVVKAREGAGTLALCVAILASFVIFQWA